MKDLLVTKKILKWYDLNKRPLPWRKKVSLQKRQYYTLVSEFMLQQTQVATVIPYFKRFIKFIPNFNSLARVKNKKLIKLWEGLGYYSRARNLKKTAEVIIKPPIITVVLGTSLIPKIGSHTQKTPPTTSINDKSASSADGKNFAPRL